jgi:hypothetical protein
VISSGAAGETSASLGRVRDHLDVHAGTLGKAPGKGEVSGISSAAVEFGIAGGVVLAGLVKLLLRYGWHRLTAPKGRHRGGLPDRSATKR